MKRQQPLPPWLADLGLAGVTAIWGWSFLWVRDGVAAYPVFPFLFIRFTLAFFLFLPLLRNRWRRFDRQTLVGGILMGSALFTGYGFQTYGLTLTSASHSGFITGLFVVFTPLFEAVWLRRLPRLITILAVAVSTTGLAALALPHGLSGVNPGDVLTLGCAVMYAVHILITGRMARRHDVTCLVLAQIGTVAVLSGFFSAPELPNLLPVPFPTLKAAVLTALLATCVAYYAQTAFQKYTTPTRTALIFTLEPLFAGFFAWVLGGESLGAAGWAGGFLIVAGMILGQRGAPVEGTPPGTAAGDGKAFPNPGRNGAE